MNHSNDETTGGLQASAVPSGAAGSGNDAQAKPSNHTDEPDARDATTDSTDRAPASSGSAKQDPAQLDQQAKPAAATPDTKATGAKSRPERLDPTRYGDWEKNGRCIDF